MNRGIRTSHTGSLPRPDDLLALLWRREQGAPEPGDGDSLPGTIRRAVRDVVQRQVEIGLDLVNDGEMSKISYSTYVKDRLSGFDGPPSGKVTSADLRDFPAFAARNAGSPLVAMRPACNGPVAYEGSEAVAEDLGNLRDALDAACAAAGKAPGEAFVTAASPGVVALFLDNAWYPTDDAYLDAVGAAMRVEYEAIAGAGFTLQLDCPDLAGGRNGRYHDDDLAAFRRRVARHIEVINDAVAGIPPERMRLHLCWGNYEGPHHHDVPVEEILDLVLEARPAVLSFEAANPRHAHEWEVFRDAAIPAGKVLMPGVIDSCTNYIEHPKLVAQRLTQFAEIVGLDRVIGGTDCGLSTFAGTSRVDPDIAWAKLGSLVEGARIANEAIGR